MGKKVFTSFVLVLVLMLFSGCGKKNIDIADPIEQEEINNGIFQEGIDETEKVNEIETSMVTEEELMSECIEFPIMLEGGKLEIGSLFPFEGVNPDAGNEVGTEIASISVKNLSDQYLEEANISVLLNEGTEINFKVTELPAGASAMAFSIDNQVLDKKYVCVNVSGKVFFCDEPVEIPVQVSVKEEGTQISVTNLSSQEFSNIKMYCRCPFDEEYFGGVAYEYMLHELAIGETKTINAEEFLLGMVEVVRVEIE